MIYYSQVKWNERTYGSAVFSSFTGYNSANDALYIARHVKADPRSIKDDQTRKLYVYFANYIDTTTYDPGGIGSEYLWSDRSPLNIIRVKLQDSLHIDFSTAWARLSPSFGKYGSYIHLISHYYILNGIFFQT